MVLEAVMVTIKPTIFMSVALLFALSLMTNLSMLVVPLFSLQIFDRVLSSGSFETLYMLLAAATIIGLFYCYFEYRRQYLPTKLLQFLFSCLQEKMARQACENSDTNLYQDMSKLLSGNTNGLLLAAIDACFCPLFILVLYWLHPAFALLVLIVNISCLLLFILQQKYLAKFQVALNTKQKSHFKNIDELLRSAKNLLADNRFQYWQKNPVGQNFNDSSTELKVLESRFKTFFVAIKWALQLTLPTLGGILLLNNEITTGVLLAALIIGYRGLIPFEVILGQWQLSLKLLTLYSSWQVQNRQKNNSLLKPVPITSLSGNLMVDDLSIKLNNQYRYLLKSVNVCVKSGEALAIIGANGSGKTLLIDSLVGVGLSHSGNIYFDEYNRHLVDETWLGEQIGFVPQNLSLATASIQQVICRYQTADPDRVVEVAQQIAVHKYILSLPMGYETQVGLYGENMPPGILQRILIASALYAKPRYLFFDEADAYLDQEGQQVFRKLIVSLKEQGLTVIFATQKRSMVDVADGVLLMDGGEARYASSVDGLSMGLIRGQA